ncbi:MAG: HAD family hydrolase [Actinomycetes bacterium]
MTAFARESARPDADGRLKALVVDWGGVLTEPLDSAIRAWAHLDGVEFEHYVEVMRSWLGPHQGDLARDNPVAALERGEIEVPHFEGQLARRLSELTGRDIDAVGLLQRMFDQFEHAPAMAGLVLRARRAGLRTGLLSNSWGNEYPREGWDEMFDAIVISGEVGMRKPEPEIFAHILELLGVQADETVFVDDLPFNISAAETLGIVGVHHTSYDATATELERLFGLHLRD